MCALKSMLRNMGKAKRTHRPDAEFDSHLPEDTADPEDTGDDPRTANDHRRCWICLEDERAGPLAWPCLCPRAAHAKCIARWQLQRAGSEEEHSCRFCERTLPDWRPLLTPAEVEKVSEVVVMAVTLNDQVHRITVRPGPEGRRRFECDIRDLFELNSQDDLEFTFDCQDPSNTSESVLLEGRRAFDAAFHCASISAARRKACAAST